MNSSNSPDRFSQWQANAFQFIGVLLCLFILVAVNTTVFDEHPAVAIFAMLGLVLVFLSRPMVGCCANATAIRAIDVGLILATVLSFGYVFVQSDARCSVLWFDGVVLGDRAGNENRVDFVFSMLGILLVLEGTRRVIGWTLPLLSLAFIAYAYFGQQMPDWAFPHRGQGWEQIAQKAFLQWGGVFGIALKVMFLYVFLFVLFGTLLEQTGATGYVIRMARHLFRHSPGGPAKVAVVSSGLMGSLSGSAVANTATTGTFTIPLMRSSGFNAHTAAGVEAAASSGGALMPPVMGAGAYMMLEMVQPAVTYVEIIKAALIPAVLYYTALLFTVHFYARRIGAQADHDVSQIADENAPKMVLYQGVVFFSSFLILVAMLLSGFTAFRSVSVSLVGIIALSLFHRQTRLDVHKIKTALVDAARNGMPLIVAASCVGIVLSIVSLTGLGASFPAAIQSFSGDRPMVALLLLMISTIVLGMGLPSAVCYLLMALLVGDVLGELGTPPLAAHLFIFYFGMMSMVTPPVALAAYAGAAIAKADVLKSACAAFRFALVGFALPFSFVLRPELILLTAENTAARPWLVCASVATTLVAIVGLAAAIAGFAARRISFPIRTLLLVLSLTVFLTRWEGYQGATHLISVGLIALILAAVGYSSRSK